MKFGSICRYHSLFAAGVFALYLILGICIFRQYGMSWDETTSRTNGKIAFEFVTGQNRELLTHVDRDYGTAFELPLYAAEQALGIRQSQQVYYLRHMLTFLLFFSGSIFFYRIASRRFGSGIALAGTVFLILSPRIFADSFYNSKDIALLSGMTVAVYTLISFLNKPDFLRAIIHAAAAAFVVDVRLPGLIILPMTAVFYCLDVLFRKPRRSPMQGVTPIGIFLMAFAGFTVLFWPYLWSNPAGNMMQAFSNLSHFSRLSDSVLYLGNYVPDKYVPWHYPLVWIAFTTPLLYIGLFLLGVGTIVRAFFTGISGFYLRHRDDLIFLAWFFGPLAMVIGMNSTLYDGWRQLYFIYPSLLLVALIGFAEAHRWMGKIRWGYAGYIGASVYLFGVVRFMAVNHPYQNLYFNELAGGMEKAKQQFDLDYWGLTFQRGLEYIAVQDSSPMIPVFLAWGHDKTIYMLPESDQKRFVVLEQPEGAKYILSNYRWFKDRNNYRWNPYIYTVRHPVYHEITVDGVAVMTILKPDGNPNRI